MEPIAQPAGNMDPSFPKRTFKVAPRGASSHFVGSTIIILSSYAVTTLAMNCGKKLQEQKIKPNSS